MAKRKKQEVITCYHCGKPIENTVDLVEKRVPLHEAYTNKKGERSQRVVQVYRTFHWNCVKAFSEKMENESLTKEENVAWQDCFEYMRKTLGDEKLDSYTIARLGGLRLGKTFAKGQNIRSVERGYPFDVILNTMKFCSIQVNNALRTMTFKDQQHKVNYVMKIYENNINFVYGRMRTLDKEKQKLEKVEVNNVPQEIPDYVRKGGNKANRESLFDEEDTGDYSMENLTSLFE